MEILRQDSYNIVHLTDGKLIMEAVKLINNRLADGINFNFTKNYPNNINEMIFAPETKYIQINDHSRDFDYSEIHSLSKLEHLAVDASDKKEVNFTSFPLLKSAAIFWRPKAISLFKCVQLEELFIGKYSGFDLAIFEHLTNLKYLRINTGSIKTLKGIEKLKKLETLMLMQTTKLEDLRGIEELSNLRCLRIDNCKNVRNIKFVKELKNIDTLQIRGTTPVL